MKKVVMAVAAVALIAGFAGCKKKAGDNSLAELKASSFLVLMHLFHQWEALMMMA